MTLPKLTSEQAVALENQYGAHNYHYQSFSAKGKGYMCGMWKANATTIFSLLTLL